MTTISFPTAPPLVRRLLIVRRLGGALWPTLIVALIAVAILAPLLPLQDVATQRLSDSLAPPSASHLLGADELGRDVLARLVFGARTTFLSSLLCVAVAVALGLPAGLIAGYRRGLFDQIVSRIADGIMAVPPLVLLLAVIAAIGPGLAKSMIILGVILSPRLYRVVRGETMVLAGTPFLEVGLMSGCSKTRIVTRYLLANLKEQVAVQITLLLGYAVLTEAGISFLGFGVQPPDPSLGVLLKSSIEFLDTAPILALAPGLVMTVFIIACNVVGDMRTRPQP